MLSSRSSARNVALVCCFTPLYAIFSLWSLFPIIGAMGKFITVATIMAPLIGIILGPHLGVAVAALGGIIGASIAQTGPFGLVSFMPGASASFCSGLLYNRKQWMSVILYSILLLMFAFYPRIGPAWSHPSFLWLQIIGLVVLLSPLKLKAVEILWKRTNLSELTFGVGVTSFIATLFSHIVGSIMFEIMYWPIIIPEPNSWRLLWQTLTFVYPIERTIITIVAAVVGAGLIKAIRLSRFEIGGK